MASSPVAYANPNIFKLEIKPKAVLMHEIGSGAPCLNCFDKCTGLDLHYWRKICKICQCRMDQHDVQVEEQDHGRIMIGRLFDVDPTTIDYRRRNLNNNNSSIDSKRSPPIPKHPPPPPPPKTTITSGDPKFTVHIRCTSPTRVDMSTQYTWVPAVDPQLVHKYMSMIPEEERPIVGTDGAQRRRQRLTYQLPYHDCDPTAAQAITTDAERNDHQAFIDTIKQNVVGMGHVVDVDEHQHANVCDNCKTPLQTGDVGVVTDHGDAKDMWHPHCFRCVTCDQPLVDMLYFFKAGKYYCGRHFGDTMYPRCSACDELIFAKEYTRAEDKDWHLDHFACFSCDRELGGHRYLVKSEQPYCLDCYMIKFARTCNRCQLKIAADVERISHGELHWHVSSQCFLCYQCSKSLVGKQFVIKSGNTFCSYDCKRLFADSNQEHRI